MTKKPTKKPAGRPKPPAKDTPDFDQGDGEREPRRKRWRRPPRRLAAPMTRMVLELALANLSASMAALKKAKRDEGEG